MRKLELSEIGNELVVKCSQCLMSMPYTGAFSDRINIFCGLCANDIDGEAQKISSRILKNIKRYEYEQ